MSEQKRSRLEEFISLTWYEAFLRFVANFIAKSSEILLTAGLVVSSANFLSDGSMLKDGTPFAIAWAWTQAIAIDGSLGVSFYSVFQSLKQRDWIKFILYSILTALLTLVAWFITEGDIFSHAVNTSSHQAMLLIGIDVRLLSTLRAIAVVGFVLMGRLRDITLWEHPQKQATTQQIKAQEQEQSQEVRISEEDLELLIQSVLQKRFYSLTVTPEEASENIAIAQPGQHAIPEKTGLPDKQPDNKAVGQMLGEGLAEETGQKPVDSKTQKELPMQENIDTIVGQEERLLQAYRELQQEGQHISGRALAQRAHVRRSTCLEWLRTQEQSQQRQQDAAQNEPSTEPLAQISAEMPEFSSID